MTFAVHVVLLTTIATGFLPDDSLVCASDSSPQAPESYREGFLRYNRGLEDGALGNEASIVLTALIPLIAGITGWVTNVLALHLTFYPLEFIGLYKPYFGWQGIIPSRAKEMAEISTDLIQQNLLRIHEVFDQLSPEEFASKAKPEMRKQIKDIVDRVARNNLPEMWDRLPEMMKQELYDSVVEDSPPYLANFIRNMQAEIEQVISIQWIDYWQRSLIASTENDLTCADFWLEAHGGENFDRGQRVDQSSFSDLRSSGICFY